MPATIAGRLLLRRPQHLIARRPAFRQASTTAKATDMASETASKAKETASNTTSQASRGLSRVSSSAGSGLSRAGQGISRTLGRLGGRTRRLIAFVETLIPPTIYYSKVGLELSKMVFQGQKMSPPNVSTFQTYLQPMVNLIRNPAAAIRPSASESGITPETVLSRIRNVNRSQMVSAGVVMAEVLGFFTVGEMLGRMKLVGYRGDVHHHETATPHEPL